MDIIITGAGKGIGFELVRCFAEDETNRVLAVSRNVAALNSKNFATSKNLFLLSTDLTDESSMMQLVNFVEKNHFKPAILINNAGILVNKTFRALTSADFDAMFDLNVKAPFLLVQTLLPFFIANTHIVNIGSMGGFQGSVKFPGLSLYSASKGALAILTESLAAELVEFQIRCNCLALGAAQTEMLSSAFPGYQAPVSAQEMAGFIFDFACNSSKFINGKVIPVSVSTP